MPQVPRLFRRDTLRGYDDFGDFIDTGDVTPGEVDTVYDVPQDPNTPIYEIGAETPDYTYPDQPVSVNDAGNVVNSYGETIYTPQEIANIAQRNPGREAAAIAQDLKRSAPDWAAQFKSSDQLLQAAYGLYNTVKAVTTGKPLPQTVPGVRYAPGTGGGYGTPRTPVKPVTSGFSTIPGNIPPTVLLGAAALVAFMALKGRK